MSLPSTTWVLIPDAEAASTAIARSVTGIASGVDWALDLDTGDLIFPLRYTTGLEAVAQGIRIRLLNFRGEWFLNLDDGVPYLARDGVTDAEAILGQKFDKAKATAAFRTAIQSAPGIAELASLEVAFDGATRALSVSFQVRSTFGVVVVNELEL